MAILSTPLMKARSGLALACAAALIGACGSAAPPSAAPATSNRAPQTITVTMTDFAFALDHPPDSPGAYVFHAVNAGKYPHAVELDGAGVLRSAADGGFWDMPGQCVQVSGSRLAFHRVNP